MAFSSLLFRRQSAAPAPGAARTRPLRDLLKPWPLAPANEAIPLDEGSDEVLSIEPCTTIVRERLSRFVAGSAGVAQ